MDVRYIPVCIPFLFETRYLMGLQIFLSTRIADQKPFKLCHVLPHNVGFRGT